VPGPEVPEYFRAFSLLQMRDAETAKDVEATLDVFDGLKRGWRLSLSVFDCKSWAPVRSEEQSFRPVAYEVLQYFRQREAQIHFAFAALCFQEWLNLSLLGFLLNVENPEVGRDVFVDFEP
jgi:hypothetical protein